MAMLVLIQGRNQGRAFVVAQFFGLVRRGVGPHPGINLRLHLPEARGADLRRRQADQSSDAVEVGPAGASVREGVPL